MAREATVLHYHHCPKEDYPRVAAQCLLLVLLQPAQQGGHFRIAKEADVS